MDWEDSDKETKRGKDGSKKGKASRKGKMSFFLKGKTTSTKPLSGGSSSSGNAA